MIGIYILVDTYITNRMYACACVSDITQMESSISTMLRGFRCRNIVNTRELSAKSL